MTHPVSTQDIIAGVRRWRFTVDGPLCGYRAGLSRKGIWDPRYRDFKGKVWVLALEAGFDGRKVDPRERVVRLGVFVFWKGRPRVDWKNIYGGIEDALFHQDRYVQPGPVNGFSMNSGRPCECAEIVIEIGEGSTF